MENKSLHNIQKYAENKVSSVIIKSNCKLCNSEYRSKAEDLYLETSNISSVFRMLKSKNEDISIPAIRSHLKNHFIDQQQQEKIKDYAADIVKWKEMQASKEERLKTYLAILEKRIFQIAASIDDRTDVESIKTTETLAKLVDQAAKIQFQLDEENMRVEPAKVVIRKLQEIIEIRVKTSKSAELKNTLIDLVSDLQGNIGGLLENG
jgi:hypothetical protein